MAKVSVDFVDGPHLLQLAQTAKLWGNRPSQWFPGLHPIEAWQLDLACAVVYWEWQNTQAREAAASRY
jgi:hypothetical protein